MTGNLTKLFPPAIPWADFLLGLILLAYPALLFLLRGGMNASLFLLTIIAVVLLVIHRREAAYAIDNPARLFGIAMTFGLLAILASQLYHDDLKARYFDSNTRFLLAVPVFLVLRYQNMKTLSVVQFAFPLGAIAALGAAMLVDPKFQYTAVTSFLNHIHLGDMALLLGFLSVFSIDWFGKDKILVKTLKWLGLLAGVGVSILSSARGGWIAIPAFAAIYAYCRSGGNSSRKIALALMLVCVAALFGYFFVEPIHQRLWLIYSDLTSFGSGNLNSSIGVRLQLWKVALHMIAGNPVFGVGADGFGRAMDGFAASGFITPEAAGLGKGEVHNEILAQTVRFGFPGLCSILAIYFVPFVLFANALKSRVHVQRVASMLGMCATSGFFVFGLTVETFDLKMTAAFYSLTVAVLLAIAIHKPKANAPAAS